MISRSRQTLLGLVAGVTRKFRPRGTERFLRWIHHPDRKPEDGLCRVMPYSRDLKISVNTSDFIEWSIFFYGYYEPQLAAWIKMNLPVGGTAVDIGANIGCHTLLMAERVGPGGQVLAYEPHPLSFARLQANLRLNGFNNTRAFQAALSSRSGEATLYGPEAGTASRGVASFYPGNIRGKAECFNVRISTLDQENAARGLKRVDLIKIDTEGNEVRVLEGALETIEEFQPLILFEYSPRTWSAAGVNLEEAARILKACNYRLERVDRKALTDKEPSDLLGCPKGRKLGAGG